MLWATYEQHLNPLADHAELRRPFYHVPHRAGIAGTAAQFILHVNDLMNAEPRRVAQAKVA